MSFQDSPSLRSPLLALRAGRVFCLSAAIALSAGCGPDAEWALDLDESLGEAPGASVEETTEAELTGSPLCVTTVTASGDDGNAPANVLDGDPATRWSMHGSGAWIRYDFGTPRKLSAVDLAWFRGAERVAFFSVESSSDGQSWTPVFQGHSSGTSDGIERHALSGASARYVRLVGHGNSVNDWNSLTEMKFYEGSQVNVASVTALTHDGNVPANTLDGNLGTRWSAYGEGVWIQYDLGSTMTLSGAELAWYRGNERAASFALDVSSDGTTWSRIYTGNSSGKTLQHEAVPLTPAAARYVRVVGFGNPFNDWTSLTSVRLRAVPFTTTVTATSACGGAATSPTTSATPNQLLGDFESMSATGFGGVTRSALESSFNKTFLNAYGLKDLSVVSEGGNEYLRQRYVPTSVGSPRVGYVVPLPGAMEVWASYRMYLEPGWEFVQGGKLPGLAGGSMPTGGQISDHGFTARLMWRAGGRMAVYAYHHDRPSKYGQDFPLRNADGSYWIAPVGQWFTVRQRIKMNTSPSSYDGEVEVWINGQRKVLKQGLRWRKTTAYTADRFYYSSFYGGNSSAWSPSKTTHARFDSIKVASTAGGVD